MPTYQTSHSPRHRCSFQLAEIRRLDTPGDAELIEALGISQIVHVGGFAVWVLEAGQGPWIEGRSRRIYDRLARDFPAVLRLIEEATALRPVQRIEVEIREDGAETHPPLSSHQIIEARDRVLAFIRREAAAD